METPPRQCFGDTFKAVIPDMFTVDETVCMEGSIAVLKAAHSEEMGKVVLKIPHPLMPRISITTIRHEAWVLEAFDHPNVVSLVDVIEDQDILVLENLEANLNDHLVEFGQPCLRRGFEMMSDILEGLCHIHLKGWVHCDLAPRNVALRGNTLVIIDFGVAREAGQRCARLHPDHTEDVEADAAMDIFALGLIMCRIFSRELLPSPYKDFIDMFLDDDPDERPSSDVALVGAQMALEILRKEEEARMQRKRCIEQVYSDGVDGSNLQPTQRSKRVRLS